MSKNGVHLSTSTNGDSTLGGTFGNSTSVPRPFSRDDDKPSNTTTLNGELMKSKIFVGGISQKTTDEDLKTFFAAVAHVLDVRIITDNALLSKSGEPRRYAFVEFASQEDVRKVLATYSEKQALELDGRRLNVAPAYRRQPTFGRTFGPSSPPSYGGYQTSSQPDLTAGFGAGQPWMSSNAASPIHGTGHQAPSGFYQGLQYPYMAPHPYYSGMMSPATTAQQALQAQYVQAVAAMMMQQQQVQTNSSPLASRTMGQQGSTSQHNGSSAMDMSDLTGADAMAAFHSIYRDQNAIQRQQHDMTLDYAGQQAMMQPQQMDFRPSVSGQQPNERHQYRQGSGRPRNTGYGQQGTFASNSQHTYQGNFGSNGRINQAGSHQGRNASNQAGVYGPSPGRSPNNLVSFPQQNGYSS